MSVAPPDLLSAGFEGFLGRRLGGDEATIAAVRQALACLAPLPEAGPVPSTWVLAGFLETEAPLGGLKMLYRLVDVLNANGFPAAVVHARPGFRCDWFENQTAVRYLDGRFVRRSDLLVVPEVFGPHCAEIGRGARKVIYNQNAYYTFQGYTLDPQDRATPYRDPEVAAALVVSEDSRDYLSYVFPELERHRIRHSVRADLFFHPGAPKRRQICFMPRKGEAVLLQVINILKQREALDGVELVPVEALSEREVAARLREALLFLSASAAEGFGLPVAEAMACGCVAVGFPAGGGRELMQPGAAVAVAQDDVIALAQACEDLLRRHREAPAEVEEMGRRAAAFIQAGYSREAEERSIVQAWRSILGEAA